jgi:hypothetical protein
MGRTYHGDEPPDEIRCRHVYGDPSCNCWPETEDDAENNRDQIDPDAQMCLDGDAVNRWCASAIAVMPPAPGTLDIADDAIREEVAEIRRRAVEIIESIRSDI